jgi:hypothetical protein
MTYAISAGAEQKLRAIEARVASGDVLSPRLHGRKRRMKSTQEPPPVEIDCDGADYRAGYAAGQMTGLAADRAQCWVPVPVRWRHVVAGDVILDRHGRPHVVTWIGAERHGIKVLAIRLVQASRIVDPDEQATVLLPAVEVDARVALADGGIATRILERRPAQQ